MAETKSTQRFDLSDADVKEAIAEWVERKFGAGNPLVVDVDVRAITTGYGMNESTGYVVKVAATRTLGRLSAVSNRRLREPASPVKSARCSSVDDQRPHTGR